MSRFTDLFQEPTPAPDPTPDPAPEISKNEKVKSTKTFKNAKRKFKMD